MTVRQFAIAIGLAAAVCGSAPAQTADQIEWSATRALNWDDFRGPIPRGTDPQRVAATAGSLAWSYEYTIQWSGGDCRFRIDRIDSQALFHPETSWVRPGHRNDEVLLHEQGHFNILQIYKSRLDAGTRDFLREPRPCRGRTESRAARNTQDAIERLVGPIYDKTWQDYRNRQASYDRETRHGTDAAAQSRWNRDIESELNAPDGN